MDNYFEENKKLLIDELLPLMPESKSYDTLVDGLLIVKRDQPIESEVCLQQPIFIFSVQGEKRYAAGRKVIDYRQGQIVFQGAPMPCSSYVLKASESEPYIAMVLAINMQILTELIYSSEEIDSSCINQSCSSLGVIDVTDDLVDSFLRLAKLLNKSSDDIKIIAPLIIKEIYYYLLKTPLREKLISFAVAYSQNNKILKAVTYLKENYIKKLSINDLADAVNMSPATFHRHFKMVTTLSPIQYQKSLRLLEAARILQYENTSVSETAYRVGYESLSQFTREYKRYFKTTPKNKQP